MTLKMNILANYLGAGVVALAPILALPWYLAALGPKQFGLIGFVVMLQAVLGLLDAGMSQALVREVAKRLGSADGGQRSTASLLFGFERVYWGFALCAGCVTLLLANTIATYWLNLGDLPIGSAKLAVYGSAFIFAAQFPGSVYRSLLVGAQAQVTLNGIISGGALVRQVGGVIIVFFVPTLFVYLTWHASIAFLETLVRRRLAWKALSVKRNQVKWDAEELRPTWKSVASMSGAVWLGALTLQMDKIVLSRMATVEQFGYYTIAATVSLGMLKLIYPLVQAVWPRAIHLRENPTEFHSLSVKLLGLISMMVALSALIFMTAGEWLLDIWLRSPQAAEAIYPLMAILLIGTGFNAFYNIGYLTWLAHDKIRNVVQVNILELIVAISLLPLLVASQGAIGAAYGWLVVNFIGFLLSLGWVMQGRIHVQVS